MERERDDLANKMAFSAGEIKRLSAAAEGVRERVAAERLEKERVEMELQDVLSGFKDMERDRDGLMIKVTSQKEETDRMKQLVKELKQELEDAREKEKSEREGRQVVLRELQALKSSYKDVMKERDGLLDKVRLGEEENEKMKMVIVEVREEVECSKKREKSEREGREAVQGELQALQKERDALIEQLALSGEENERMKMVGEELREELQRAKERETMERGRRPGRERNMRGMMEEN